MKVDLDRIPKDRPCAIHIPTIEHGRAFLDEMRVRYPDMVETWCDAYYYEHRTQSGGNYYFPRFHQTIPRMTHGDRTVYIDMGVELMSFDDILVTEVELDTVLGDMPIESLFG